MKKLIVILAFFATTNHALFAQETKDLKSQYEMYKALEKGQEEKALIFNQTVEDCREGRKKDIEALLDYIEFANQAIARWQIALETPEVLFLDKTVFEAVEMIKSLEENGNADERILALKYNLRELIKEHIRIMSMEIEQIFERIEGQNV